MMCVPPGWCEHSNTMIVPISVMPAVSNALAPHCSSISALVCGIDPAGSPDRISRDTAEPRRSTPSDVRLLRQPERVRRRGRDDRGAEVDDLADSRLGRLGAAGHVQHADLLHRVVQAPEADERAVPERDVGGVERTGRRSPRSRSTTSRRSTPSPCASRSRAAARARWCRTWCGCGSPPRRRSSESRRTGASPPARPSSHRGSGPGCGAGRRACGAVPDRTARRRIAAGTRGFAPPPIRIGAAAWQAAAPRSAPDRGSRSSGSSRDCPSPPLARRENT